MCPASTATSVGEYKREPESVTEHLRAVPRMTVVSPAVIVVVVMFLPVM